MRLVTIGGLLLLVATPLAASRPDVGLWALLVLVGLFETLAGACYWWYTRRRGSWPLRGSELPVVLAAFGMLIGVVLTYLGGAVGIAGVLLWWIFALVFVVSSLGWWWSAARFRRSADQRPTGESDSADIAGSA